MKSLNEKIFERQYTLEKQVEALYAPILPYHNFDHVKRTLTFGENILQDCLNEHIDVDQDIVYLAILFHDAGYHEDHVSLGFKTKEAYSASLAEMILSRQNYRALDINQVKDAIMSTEKDATFGTAEQKAVRAADLSGMAADYSLFLANSVKLKVEYEMLSNRSLSWNSWKKASADTIKEYIFPEIPLTNYFQKRYGDLSPFEKAVRRNLNKLSMESKQPEIPNHL